MHSTWASRFNEFGAGFLSPLRALGLVLNHPSLLGLFILPMLITLTILSIAIYALLTGVWSIARDLLTSWIGSSAGSFGAGTLTFLASILLLYFALGALSLLTQLVSSPFNDLLAEKTERALGIASKESGALHLLGVFWIDVKKTLVALALTLLCLFLGWVPLLGLLSVLGMAFTQAFTYFSYPQNRRKEGLFSSLLWMANHPWRSMGFGLAALLLLATPVVNLFALPLCVMSGTLTYFKK